MTKEERIKSAEAVYPTSDRNGPDVYHLNELRYAQQEAFIRGAQAEAESKWISVDVRTPIAYESGCWDGLMSDFVLAVNRRGDYVVARVYEGKMDGSHFIDWCDSKDNLLDLKEEQIVKWQELPQQ